MLVFSVVSCMTAHADTIGGEASLSIFNHSPEERNHVIALYRGEIDNLSGEIDSILSLEMTDTTLNYEIFDNWVNLDVSLTLQQFGISNG